MSVLNLRKEFIVLAQQPQTNSSALFRRYGFSRMIRA